MQNSLQLYEIGDNEVHFTSDTRKIVNKEKEVIFSIRIKQDSLDIFQIRREEFKRLAKDINGINGTPQDLVWLAIPFIIAIYHHRKSVHNFLQRLEKWELMKQNEINYSLCQLVHNNMADCAIIMLWSQFSMCRLYHYVYTACQSITNSTRLSRFLMFLEGDVFVPISYRFYYSYCWSITTADWLLMEVTPIKYK